MKKHIFRTLAVMLFVCLGMAAFAACEPKQEANTFTVTYAAGEGTGTAPATEKHAEGETFTVAENSFTYEGHTFKAWNDGTKDVAAGETYTMPAKDVTFTATWTAQATAEKVTVTFSLGDNTTGTAPAAQEVNKGAQVTLPEAPAWAGHKFLGWKVGTNETLKQAGDKITASANVTVTAQWAEEVTVTYSLGEGVTGNVPASQTVEKNGEVTLPAAPSRAGYDFVGWKVGNDIKNAGDKITVTASMTVTAQWEAQISGYWTATNVDPSTFGGSGSNVSVEVAVKRNGAENIYVVLKVTQGNDSWMYAVYAGKGASAWECDLGTMTVEGDKLKVTLTIFGGSNLELSGHTDLGNDLTATGTYKATVGQAEYYMDLDQYGYDGGYGYMNDAEFVSVGKYLAVFEYGEEEESSECAVVLVAGQEGALEAYDMEGHVGTFATCEAREQSVSYNVFKLEQNSDRVYIIIEGTYAGFTPNGLRDLQEDQVIEEYNISLFLKKTPWSIYPNVKTGEGLFVNRELTIAAGVITAKFDVTDLPITDVGYGAAAMNNGTGDLNYGSTPSDYEIKAGSVVYTLKGSSGNVVLNVEEYNHATDWTDVSATPTDITLTLNDAQDKVLLTVSGTYTGTTKDHMKELLSQKYNTFSIVYFWGPDNGAQEGKDLVITTTETDWTIQVDVTDLLSDIYDNDKAEGTVIQNATPGDGINGRPGTSPGVSTEFQVKSVVDITVECGGRVYTLVQSGLYGHNTIYIGEPVTVTYNLGGWEDGTVPGSAKIARSANVVLPTLDARDGYFFKGWKVGQDENGGDVIKQPGERLAVTADITVTAVWASDAVSGTWTYTKDGATTKLYVGDGDGGINVVLETADSKEAMFFALGASGWTCGAKTLTVTGDSLILKAEETITFTGRVTFTDADTATVPTGVYSYITGEKDALYVDFDYKAIDLGQGYLDDAEFATVGQFVVALVEKNGAKQGPVFTVATSGEITAYNASATMTLATTTAREKIFGADNGRPCEMTYRIELEDGKIYLYVSGTYQGYKPSEFLKLCEDADVYTANISIYPNVSPWNPIYPDLRESSYNYIERTHVIGEGKVTAKLDITGIPFGTYGIASQNNGYGDLAWGSNETKSVSLGGASYTLSADGAGKNAQITVSADWTGVTAAVTSISIALDNEVEAQATKVLLTYEGTYSGCTKEAMKSLLEAKYNGNSFFYFWGAASHADPVKDFTVTVEEGKWKIVIDVTDLPVEPCRNLCGFWAVNGSSITMQDLKYGADIIKVNSITFKGKTYHLVLENGWFNNGLNVVEAVAE